MKKILIKTAVVFILFLGINAPAYAQMPPGFPGVDVGQFSLGGGIFAGGGGDVDGLYGLARYEISTFQFEIDLGVSGGSVFIGAADYIYHLPTAEGITQTGAAIGGGITFTTDSIGSEDSNIGFNVLGKVDIADSYALQARVDIFDSELLWSFSLAYIMN